MAVRGGFDGMCVELRTAKLEFGGTRGVPAARGGLRVRVGFGGKCVGLGAAKLEFGGT